MDLIPFRASVVRALPIVAMLACSSPTDVNPLRVSIRPVAFATQDEWLQWPRTASVEGGNDLVVRGTAFVGCGRAAARVQRRDNVVGVEITAIETDRPCLASLIASSVPFEATVSGLSPGAYRVRVGVVGLKERVEGAATITAP